MSLKRMLVLSFLPTIVIGLMVYSYFKNKESFGTGWFHRSFLASSFWISKPQVQHTLQDLKLQYPDHKDYFENSCHENNPNNAEVCRYHKHRFDPAQM